LGKWKAVARWASGRYSVDFFDELFALSELELDDEPEDDESDADELEDDDEAGEDEEEDEEDESEDDDESEEELSLFDEAPDSAAFDGEPPPP
jgi:hypothetical protein